MMDTVLAWVGTLPYGTFLTNPYVFGVLIILTFALLANLVFWGFALYLKVFAKKTETLFDDLFVEKTRRPIFLFLFTSGFELALRHVGVLSWVLLVTDALLAIFFLFFLSRLLDTIVQTWGHQLALKTETKIDEVLLPLLHKVTKVIFILIGFLWILHIWHIDITPYLAGVGISGVILGLALQDSLKNLFGGVSLLLDETYHIGDKVRLESGDLGTIIDIGLRSTKMVTFDNEVIYIPNGYLANSRVRNYARPDTKVRVKVMFGVEYGSDPAKVRKTIFDVVSKTLGVLKDPVPQVQFMEMGDFALKFRLTFWIPHWDQEHAKKIEMTEKVYTALNKAGIVIAFPTQIVHLMNEPVKKDNSRKIEGNLKGRQRNK
ncbi:mechanosensitive ion channel family protein [Candidatus Woesearchaeota archaeon]|nr:mechanosensitive ion channel family protein [Candidatus Woesearchaeota archaeon]